MMKHLAKWTAAAAVGMVLFAASAAHAGRYPAPGMDAKVVGALDDVTYTERFMADELATVTVRGDGDTLLKLEVYDGNGNLVDSDVGTSCTATWAPIWTGRFTIKVINLGLEANAYHLKTN